MAQGREFGSRPDRPGDVPGSAVGGVAGRDLLGDARRGHVQLVRLVGHRVLVEHHTERAEARRFNDVDPDGEELVVHAGDDVRPGEAQHLVAALEGGSTEVVGAQIQRLDEGAEGAVEDDDALLDRVEVGLGGHPPNATGHVAR